MSKVGLDAQKAIDAFNSYFEVWPDLYVVYLNLHYHSQYGDNHTSQKPDIHLHWLRLQGILDTHSLVVGHLQMLIHNDNGLFLHCFVFFKYEQNFDELYWIHEIGNLVWMCGITKGTGTFTYVNSGSVTPHFAEFFGLITTTNKEKRKKFIEWLSSFLQDSLPPYPFEVFNKSIYVKVLRKPIRRMLATPHESFVASIPLEQLLSPKELDVLWSVKKQSMSHDAVRQIGEAEIIYKQLLYTKGGSEGTAEVLSMLTKIETFVYAVRFERQMAFDITYSKKWVPIQQMITVLGRQLLDLYQNHIDGLKPATMYSFRITDQLSYSVKAFFTVWYQITIHESQQPAHYYQWTDWQCIINFNQFVQRLREYLHGAELQPVTPLRQFVWSAQRPTLLPSSSIHQRLNREDNSASSTLEDARTYIKTLFQRNVVLIKIRFDMKRVRFDELSQKSKSAIFTEFLRYAANTAPLNHSLGYIGQWCFDRQRKHFPEVIFFLDASYVFSIDEVRTVLNLYWRKFLTEKVSKNKRLKLGGFKYEGNLETSVIFNTLAEFNNESCRVNITDKKLQKLFISHVVLYLCKSRLYDHRYKDRPEKGLIKGTIKTATRKVEPKTIRGRVKHNLPTDAASPVMRESIQGRAVDSLVDTGFAADYFK